jgi:hypothetical protein
MLGSAEQKLPLPLRIATTEGRMSATEKVNILMVDDQPGKLLSYEVILRSWTKI